MKIFIKTMVIERFGDRSYYTGRIDYDDMVSVYEGGTDALTEYLYNIVSSVACMDQYDGDLGEAIACLGNGVGFGLWDEETLTALVPMILRRNEKPKLAQRRVEVEADSILFNLDNPLDDDDEENFDEDDWG